MTLTETLQLKEKYLKYDDLRALEYCEKRWQEEQCPTERWQVINFLEKMIRELQQNGIGYPKVLLLRKKEIQRGTYTIPQAGEAQTAAECTCFDGWLQNGAPCSCGKGERHRKELRGWGMVI
jgi:hypothetical protein